ncbi:MAG: MBL fold metallo-hydrolase [Rhodospirillales bacterium]|nr:MBL fold metallo-hydrolase [Alphaproteobacteria bacterium]USO03353.1 MAG: MBL fold metallo-hydrolase [Rhodospirillales bacterium]
MSAEFIILGCGSSAGVPAIGNYWGACNPEEPRNRRTRCCAGVCSDKTSLIIDTGPDLRAQYTQSGFTHLDAVLYTHAHGDHTNGIDELRTLQRRFKRQFDVFASRDTLDDIMPRFNYMFETSEDGFYPQVLVPNVLEYGRRTTVGDISFTAFDMNHGACRATGYRFGNIGYCTDMFDLDDAALDILDGIDIWIADSAGYHSRSNPVHASLEKIFSLNERIKARQVYLTAMPPTMDYATLKTELPDGYAPAYDGLKLEIK